MGAADLAHETRRLQMESLAGTLEEVFRAHHDFVWGLARGMGASPDQADDVVQDVFLVVRRRFDDFDADRAVRPWLTGITRRVLSDHRKKSRRARAREARAEAPTALTQPEPKAIADQEARAVVEFLDTLPAEQREVFVMIAIEGMSAGEVAALSNISPNTVSSRLRLARRRFSAWAQAWRCKEEGAHE